MGRGCHFLNLCIEICTWINLIGSVFISRSLSASSMSVSVKRAGRLRIFRILYTLLSFSMTFAIKRLWSRLISAWGNACTSWGECFRLMWSIWLWWFPSGDVQASLWMFLWAKRMPPILLRTCYRASRRCLWCRRLPAVPSLSSLSGYSTKLLHWSIPKWHHALKCYRELLVGICRNCLLFVLLWCQLMHRQLHRKLSSILRWVVNW